MVVRARLCCGPKGGGVWCEKVRDAAGGGGYGRVWGVGVWCGREMAE
jgi:hypothetical protein